MQNDKRPIIIKRKKIVAGGHHGGAWKVAYADFVTAMMAFFMLMWLLNATTEKQRKGIADYFNPTIPVNRVSGGGDGAFGGDSIFSEDTLVHNGTGASQSRAMRERQARGVSGVTLDEDIQRAREGMEALLQGRTGDSLTLRGERNLVDLVDIEISPAAEQGILDGDLVLDREHEFLVTFLIELVTSYRQAVRRGVGAPFGVDGLVRCGGLRGCGRPVRGAAVCGTGRFCR